MYLEKTSEGPKKTGHSRFNVKQLNILISFTLETFSYYVQSLSTHTIIFSHS